MRRTEISASVSEDKVRERRVISFALSEKQWKRIVTQVDEQLQETMAGKRRPRVALHGGRFSVFIRIHQDAK
jgi:hypothetical protein